MSYSREDYRRDLQILSLGAKGVEATEAQLRVRLYEAGRYDQLNALVNQKSESEIAHDRLLQQMQRIDDDVFQSLQLWLNTPSNDHKLFQQRKEQYDQKRAAAEAQKAQLKEEYERKYYSQKGGSTALKVVGALMFLGGLAFLLGSCATHGIDAPLSVLWWPVIAAVGAFLYLLGHE